MGSDCGMASVGCVENVRRVIKWVTSVPANGGKARWDEAVRSASVGGVDARRMDAMKWLRLFY